MIDSNEMPPVWRHLIWSSLGVSGITFVLNEGAALYFTDIFLMVAGTGFSALFVYGLISLVKDIRIGKTFSGTLKQISKNIKKAFYG